MSTSGIRAWMFPGLYYGWIIVAVSMLLDGVAFSAGQAAFSVFLAPMSEDLRWSRSILIGAVTFQSLANVAVSPLVGMIIDRQGPRIVMVYGAVVAAIGYMLLGKVTEPWQFYLCYTVAAALGLHEVGQLVTSITVSKWFIRMRGRALAFAGIGNNIGAVLILPAVAFLIATIGWRSSWTVIGGVIALVVLPPVILFIRRSPEDMGLRPDGDPPDASPKRLVQDKPEGAPRSEEPVWDVRAALTHPTTWLLVVSANLSGLAFSALVNHQVAYFIDAGLPLQQATWVLVYSHLFTIASKLFWGFLSERVPVRYCLATCYLIRTVAVLILLLGRVPQRVYGYAVVSGVSQGIGPLSAKVWADYYGRTFLGSIRGVIAPFSLVSSMGGPLFAALVYDQTKSYDAAFWVFAVTMVLSTFFMYNAKPPQRPVPLQGVAPPSQAAKAT